MTLEEQITNLGRAEEAEMMEFAAKQNALVHAKLDQLKRKLDTQVDRSLSKWNDVIDSLPEDWDRYDFHKRTSTLTRDQLRISR